MHIASVHLPKMLTIMFGITNVISDVQKVSVQEVKIPSVRSVVTMASLPILMRRIICRGRRVWIRALTRSIRTMLIPLIRYARHAIPSVLSAPAALPPNVQHV
jgi:hypothetical protein